GIMIERPFRRPRVSPGLEVHQIGERGQVKAAAGLDKPFRGGWLRQVGQQAFGRRFVLAKRPDTPKEREEWTKAPFRARRHAMRPALLGNLWGVALGHRPRARWIHDQRTPTGDEPFVVGGVVPGRRVCRKEL